MRIIYLTLAFFVLLGIGAACRTPPLLHADCAPDEAAGGCVGQEKPEE